MALAMKILRKNEEYKIIIPKTHLFCVISRALKLKISIA